MIWLLSFAVSIVFLILRRFRKESDLDPILWKWFVRSNLELIGRIKTPRAVKSVVGQGRLWPTGEWHSRSTPSFGNSRCVPALTLRAMNGLAIFRAALETRSDNFNKLNGGKLIRAAIVWVYEAHGQADTS